MKCSSLPGLLLPLIMAAPGYAQPAPTDPAAIEQGLAEMLSLATLGAISPRIQDAEVAKEADAYRIRFPLKGLADPPNAALTVLGTPSPDGVWTIRSLTFPPTAAWRAGGPPPDGRQSTGQPAELAISSVTYSVGKQDVRGTIDPSFAKPSHYQAELDDIAISTSNGSQHATQTIGSYAAAGDFVAGPDRLLTISSTSKANDFHMTVTGGPNTGIDISIRAMSTDFGAEGVNLEKSMRLIQQLRSVRERLHGADIQTGQPNPDVTDSLRQWLRELSDSAAGLAGKFNAQSTLEDLHATTGPGAAGDARRVLIALTGRSSDQRIDASADMGIDELTLSAVPAAYAPFVPHHALVRYLVKGLPADSLARLLRAASEPNADLNQLRTQATALLGNPDALVGIDPFSFDTGPMRVTGSARLLSHADGTFGGHIHIAAVGMDALMSQIQGNPGMQQVMPMLFMAKGMARPDGQRLIWDIDLGDGPPTVNGTPIGQPPHKR